MNEGKRWDVGTGKWMDGEEKQKKEREEYYWMRKSILYVVKLFMTEVGNLSVGFAMQ